MPRPRKTTAATLEPPTADALLATSKPTTNEGKV